MKKAILKISTNKKLPRLPFQGSGGLIFYRHFFLAFKKKPPETYGGAKKRKNFLLRLVAINKNS
jgi:hypothetical protein